MIYEVSEKKRALYFGYDKGHGHRLQEAGNWRTSEPKDIPGFPWDLIIDAGLLENGKHEDVYDGKVFWTCAGSPLWLAFLWWDRSGDKRPNSNSGFYVQGFYHIEREEAFKYVCSVYPEVVNRQKYPLVLQS